MLYTSLHEYPITSEYEMNSVVIEWSDVPELISSYPIKHTALFVYLRQVVPQQHDTTLRIAHSLYLRFAFHAEIH